MGESGSPLYLALVRPYLVCWIQVLVPQYKRDLSTLERDQGKSMKKVKGMERGGYEETVGELGLFSLEMDQGVEYQCL